MIFKIISTIAVGLLVAAWSFKNMRFINDWVVSKTGIGTLSSDRKTRIEENTEISAEGVTTTNIVTETAEVISQPVETLTATTVEPTPTVAEPVSDPVVIVKKQTSKGKI